MFTIRTGKRIKLVLLNFIYCCVVYTQRMWCQRYFQKYFKSKIKAGSKKFIH